ncbi:MAG: hypothetical protein WA908_05005 [Pontixanthobacter sp.]
MDAVKPALRYWLEGTDRIVLSDQVVAQVRGMVASIANQLLTAVERRSSENTQQLFAAFIESDQLLRHCHAVAIEGILTKRLYREAAIDPVNSSILSSRALSSDDDVATAVLNRQRSFILNQDRMVLPIGALPRKIFAVVVELLERTSRGFGEPIDPSDFAGLRKGFDESESRLDVLEQLTAATPENALNALDIRKSGVALFLSALARSAHQTRTDIVFATGQEQVVRMALSMFAAGLNQAEIDSQFALLHPELAVPSIIDGMNKTEARELLVSTSMQHGRDR